MSFQLDDTQKKVRTLIAQTLNLPEDRVSMTSTFKDLGADSLAQVQVIMGLEELFAIEIRDQEAEQVKTVQQAVELVHDRRKK